MKDKIRLHKAIERAKNYPYDLPPVSAICNDGENVTKYAITGSAYAFMAYMTSGFKAGFTFQEYKTILETIKNTPSVFYILETIPRGNYSVIVLSEYSLPDSHGRYMRVKTIAEFGNANNDQNWEYAIKIEKYLTSEVSR